MDSFIYFLASRPFNYLAHIHLEYFFVFEIFLVIILIVFLFINMARLEALEKKKDYEKNIISRIIINLIETKVTPEDAVTLLHISSLDYLLKQMQEFNTRFTSENWKNVRKSIAEYYLLPTARQLIKSPSWMERNFSASCFALSPEKKDLKYILELANDEVFLVKSVASEALIQLDLEEGLLQVIKSMSLAKGFTYYFYKDLIINYLNVKNYLYLQKIGIESKNENIHLACLDLLSVKQLYFSSPFLWDDLKSPNPVIRKSALKIMVQHPQRSVFYLFVSCLKDTDPEIRQEGIKGLEFFPYEEVSEFIKKMLLDTAWQVRLEAAKALKSYGPKGIDILLKQKYEGNIEAHEAAEYALNFY